MKWYVTASPTHRFTHSPPHPLTASPPHRLTPILAPARRPVDHPGVTQPSIDDRNSPLYMSRASGRSYTDLGFGRVVAQQVRGRFLTHDGEPTSRKYGIGAQRIERFYLRALAAPLPVFLAWGLGVLLLLNGFFALA